MDCRGKRKRRNIVTNYYVKPIAHLKLLKGFVVHSDAGRDITDSYFIFECIQKNSKQIDYICCGRPTAVEFAKLTKCSLPPIYNPLKAITKESVQHNIIDKNQIISNKVTWNPLRLQLYNATMLLICYWNGKPNTPLFEIKDYLERDPEKTPCTSKIKSINTMLRHTNNTMNSVLNKIKQNNNLKDFQFDLLIQKLNESNVEEFFS